MSDENRNAAERAVLTTERLILRPWKVNDRDEAQALFRYASNPHVGPSGAWPVHTSIENSMEVIRDVLAAPENYAVVLKETGEPIGSIGLIALSDRVCSGDDKPSDAMELGYWIGEPYWGQGLVPEAAREVLRHGFQDLQLAAIWGTHNVDNHKSERVMDKLGLSWVRVAKHVRMPLLPGEVYRDEAIRRITCDEYFSRP
ncbi:GNAT family N-acetyltransferase [Bifidobacterium sp.]|jgi:RimJ/RimL family protein N-acetyltransferase|uniref:GNAT family N-acetyltransferase n=1 Tax=Bifidobacterium sp. TaxID=41200 RepID=UPI0025B8C71C|nr:GNAT family N-acetyltransferase [Bifidobacterium sp.]MCH4210125.1 GNAT family N-acetyltransferase [Bifidobacterium sp.]MCI1224855.1 GNAT family N-acetyltransferase [Bifidobacterium sp.]